MCMHHTKAHAEYIPEPFESFHKVHIEFYISISVFHCYSGREKNQLLTNRCLLCYSWNSWSGWQRHYGLHCPKVLFAHSIKSFWLRRVVWAEWSMQDLCLSDHKHPSPSSPHAQTLLPVAKSWRGRKVLQIFPCGPCIPPNAGWILDVLSRAHHHVTSGTWRGQLLPSSCLLPARDLSLVGTPFAADPGTMHWGFEGHLWCVAALLLVCASDMLFQKTSSSCFPSCVCVHDKLALYSWVVEQPSCRMKGWEDTGFLHVGL